MEETACEILKHNAVRIPVLDASADLYRRSQLQQKLTILSFRFRTISNKHPLLQMLYEAPENSIPEAGTM